MLYLHVLEVLARVVAVFLVRVGEHLVGLTHLLEDHLLRLTYLMICRGMAVWEWGNSTRWYTHVYMFTYQGGIHTCTCSRTRWYTHVYMFTYQGGIHTCTCSRTRVVYTRVHVHVPGW